MGRSENIHTCCHLCERIKRECFFWHPFEPIIFLFIFILIKCIFWKKSVFMNDYRDIHFPHQNKQISFNSGSKKVIYNAFYMHFIQIGNAYYNKILFYIFALFQLGSRITAWINQIQTIKNKCCNDKIIFTCLLFWALKSFFYKKLNNVLLKWYIDTVSSERSNSW